jgi:phosphatidylserine/phosphatidylglycerophosphate/cardiolipin synthase-like enzyme
MLSLSLADLSLSRGEKQALREVFENLKDTAQNWIELRQDIFDVARAEIADRDPKLVLGWVEELMKLVQSQQAGPAELLPPESHFTPGDDCPRRIMQLIRAARSTLDICVFTITDDRLATAVLEAQIRGVSIRIITDNEKAFDLGSDVPSFQDAGVPLKVDHTPFHMHHKFAIFDKQILLTGSYNWTRGAANDNHENVIITSERRLVDRFDELFERLWRQL